MHILLILSQPLLASPFIANQSLPRTIVQETEKEEPGADQSGDEEKAEESPMIEEPKIVDEFATIANEPNLRRPFLLGTNIRVRQLFLPDSALDSYVYDNDMEGALDSAASGHHRNWCGGCV